MTRQTATLAAVLLLAVAGVFAAACAVRAEDKTITAIVNSTMDEAGNATAATATDDDGTIYNVKMDANGKKLVKELDGKKAKITGAIEEKDGEKTITVKSFKAAEE